VLIIGVLMILIGIFVIFPLHIDSIKQISMNYMYPKDTLIFENSRSKIYTVKKNPNYLIKLLKKPNRIPLYKQVKVNNDSNLSPKIVMYTQHSYVIEKMDYTFQYMLKHKMVNRNMLDKYIELNRALDKYEYKHLDIYPRNIVWSKKLNKLNIIDWEKHEPHNPNTIAPIPNDREYLINHLNNILIKKRKKLSSDNDSKIIYDYIMYLYDHNSILIKTHDSFIDVISTET